MADLEPFTHLKNSKQFYQLFDTICKMITISPLEFTTLFNLKNNVFPVLYNDANYENNIVNFEQNDVLSSNTNDKYKFLSKCLHGNALQRSNNFKQIVKLWIIIYIQTILFQSLWNKSQDKSESSMKSFCQNKILHSVGKILCYC